MTVHKAVDFAVGSFDACLRTSYVGPVRRFLSRHVDPPAAGRATDRVRPFAL